MATKKYKKNAKSRRNVLRKTGKKHLKKTGKKHLYKCDDFCIKDYMVEMKKVFKKSSEKYNIPYKSPTKHENKLDYNTCKKTFCNKKCEGYDFFGNIKQQKKFNNKIINGFQTSYSTNRIDMFKKKGAISGCVDVIDYNINHK